MNEQHVTLESSTMNQESSRTRGSYISVTLFGLITLLLIAVFGTIGCSSGDDGPNPSGTLEAKRIDIGTTLPARISVVRVEEGERVAQGDTLIRLDTELLQLQRAQTAANRATIDAQMRGARDQLTQARETLRLQEKTLARLQQLIEQGSVTQQQVDEAQTRRDVTAAQVSAARNQIDALAAEGAKLDAGLAVLDRQLEEGIITAPRDGTILLRNVEPGEVAGMGSSLLRMADLSILDLRVYLDIEDMDRVKLGQKVEVLVDALEGEVLQGTVSWISDEAEFTPKNAQTRNARAQLVYAIKVTVSNPDGRLHIGMPAEIRLPKVQG
ncbi:efflux RND transporter periplasmic adaptor subunit [bacterium]|nr:efflux RND transporter periplasmic adaptor subunit [bacterium]